MSFRIVALVLFLFIAVWGFIERRMLLIQLAALLPTPGLLDAQDEGPGVRWVDDYFTVEQLDARTYAIGEPRYFQQNYSYLIIGADRAVLFDAGPGVRDIRPIVESLTDIPITFVPSHFHYDHLGDGVSFSRVAVVDLPYLRARAPDDRLTLTRRKHLGFVEGFAIPTLQVTEWLPPDTVMSLGDRDLLVLHTPGHTEDSISLLDLSSGLLFTGDFICPSPLFAFLPNSHMGAYLEGANTILEAAPPEPRIFAAHRAEPPGAPELSLADVKDLEAALESIRLRQASGRGLYPVTYEVNDRIRLLAEPRWLQRWE